MGTQDIVDAITIGSGGGAKDAIQHNVAVSRAAFEAAFLRSAAADGAKYHVTASVEHGTLEPRAAQKAETGRPAEADLIRDASTRFATARFLAASQQISEVRAIGVLNACALEVPVTPEMIAAAQAIEDSYGVKENGELDVDNDVYFSVLYRAMKVRDPSQSITVVTDDVLAQRNAAWDRITVLERERDVALEELSVARTFRGYLCERQARALGDAVNTIAAKDARIAELDTMLAQRPAIQTIQPVRPSPFREFPSDPRRLGPLITGA